MILLSIGIKNDKKANNWYYLYMKTVLEKLYKKLINIYHYNLINEDNIKQEKNTDYEETIINYFIEKLLWWGSTKETYFKDKLKLKEKVKILWMDSIKNIDFENLIKNNIERYGEFTLLKENRNINFKKASLFIINPNDKKFKKFIGSPRWKFYQYLQKEYNTRYNFPGLEYEQYLFSLPIEKIPMEFKNKLYRPEYIFIGSTYRSKDGSLRVPSALYWNGTGFARNLKVLLSLGKDSGIFDDNLDADERIILIKKEF